MDLKEKIQKFPRFHLTRLPTPMDFLLNLSDRLGLEIYLKRDDLTDLALGGDKPRKLEFEIAKAIADDCDTIITCGSAQSNMVRLTTAAAIKAGLKTVAVLSNDEYASLQGNLLVTTLMGAEIHMIETEDHWDLEAATNKIIKNLLEDGHKPHFIPVSGTTPLSCLGYVNCGIEIIDQMQESGLDFNYVYTPFGTGGIFTSLLYAFHFHQQKSKFIGISVNRGLQECHEYIKTWWAGINELMDAHAELPNNFDVTENFIGKAYGDPTDAGIQAIKVMAETEGILMDPVYSGKMFSGFLDHHEKGYLKKGDKVLLIHSGGVPALFAYSDKFNFKKKR